MTDQRMDQRTDPRMDTVQACLRAYAACDATALRSGEESWTWRQYVADAGRRASALRSLLSPDRPPHVGVLLENTPEMVLALAAGALGGHVTAGINLTRRGSALAADVLRADCQVLLTDTASRPLLDGIDLPGVRVVDTGGPGWAELLAGYPDGVPEAPEASPAGTFMLIFTSGTGGSPKAVQVSNHAVLFSGSHLVRRFGLGPDDVCYLSMPLFHSNAILAGYAVALCAGASMALAPRFSASGFLPDVRRYGATYMNYVGKPLAYILRTPRRPDDADNPLRLAFGNEASDRDIAEFADRFGTAVWDGFGSTETAIIVSRGDDTPPGSIGTPWEGVAVYDRKTRAECPRAVLDGSGRVTNLDEAVGELVNTGGSFLFSGYYNDPEATAERLDGGIYWSGDLAYRDADGYVYLAGRTSDWLRVDGENLAAGLVEHLLMRHPGVSQAAVYPIPDPDAGDLLVAALVPRGPATLDPAGFEAFLARQEDLSPKAWPSFVRIAGELPSTATHKVLKRELIRQGLEVTDEVWIRDERGTAYRVRAGTVAPAPQDPR